MAPARLPRPPRPRDAPLWAIARTPLLGSLLPLQPYYIVEYTVHTTISVHRTTVSHSQEDIAGGERVHGTWDMGHAGRRRAGKGGQDLVHGTPRVMRCCACAVL